MMSVRPPAFTAYSTPAPSPSETTELKDIFLYKLLNYSMPSLTSPLLIRGLEGLDPLSLSLLC